MDCWEYMGCDLEIRFECPAYRNKRGRECWKVTGTKCDGGKLEFATREEKIEFCHFCGFYKEHASKF